MISSRSDPLRLVHSVDEAIDDAMAYKAIPKLEDPGYRGD